jgi:hypothetical protein
MSAAIVGTELSGDLIHHRSADAEIAVDGRGGKGPSVLSSTMPEQKACA